MERILLPDIGDFSAVEIIEVLVAVGDVVAVEQPLITLESDKATMDVPASLAGAVTEVLVKAGDKVSQGDAIVMVDTAAGESAANASVTGGGADTGGGDSGDGVAGASAGSAAAAATPAAAQSATDNATAPAASASAAAVDIFVPDIGDFSAVEIIEMLVAVGDTVSKEQPLFTLESDKATMDVPSPMAGTIRALHLKTGDKVSQGDLIAAIAPGADSATPATAAPTPAPTKTPPPAAGVATGAAAPAPPTRPPQQPAPLPPVINTTDAKPYAGPAIRRLARELGVNLTQVVGSGKKGRIRKEDVQQFVKQKLTQPEGNSGFNLPAAPEIDFRQFGEISIQSLSRINKLSAAHLHRCWLTAPHVTQFDEADITDMEEFRQSLADEAKKGGYKMTPLAFLIKAAVKTLRQFPRFNASLAADGENLVLKHYYHIGVAVDTPNGLVVPVLRDADQKGLTDIARELAEISERARAGTLKREEMQGGCFTISSLGGIGGSYFAPIINLPEVAILGVSRAQIKPVWDGKEAFIPRRRLPLALSYDHRVIDGAAGARFITFYSDLLGDIRRLAL